MKGKTVLAVMAAGAAVALTPGVASAGAFDATASPGSSSADVLAADGVATLHGTSTSSTGSQGEVLSVLGQNLLSKSGDNVNGGALAALGGVADQINGALCPKGPDQAGTCVVVLYSHNTNRTLTNPVATQEKHNASSSTVGLVLGNTGLFVLGSESFSVKTTDAASGASRCDNGARAVLLATRDQTTTKTAGLQQQDASINQAC